MSNSQNYKSDFPIFKNNSNLVFLDSAASSQKPQCVLDDVKYFCENDYANVHRGAYSLSLKSTDKMETARKEIANFFGTSAQNLIFTKNATEASNIFTSGILKYLQNINNLDENIEILMPVSEHHSSLLPALAENNKIITKYIYPNISKNSKNFGIFDEKDFEKNITENTKLIICAHISNVTGQIFDIKKIAKIIQKINKIREEKTGNKNNKIYFAVDASQSAPHVKINFDELSKISCDAMFITGHKLGAGGIGALLLSEKTAKILPNYAFGGGIVNDVQEDEYSLLDSPARFETGTPSIENIIGFHSAIKYLQKIGGNNLENIQKHEAILTKYILQQFSEKLPNFIIVGDSEYKNLQQNRSSLISFYHKNIHHSDIAILLAEKNIAVRAGMHCANPFHHYLNVKGTTRASFWIYNSTSDIDILISELQHIEKMFG